MRNRKRNRMKGYDYSRDNLYFVTSCVKRMVCCFGDIDGMVCDEGTGRDLSLRIRDRDPAQRDSAERKMALNELGIIVDNQLRWLEEQYPYVVLHCYVVMPNHVHAVVEIDSDSVGTGRDPSVHDPSEHDPSEHDPSLQRKIKSLSEIMGAFKMTSSKLIHLAGYPDFHWQRSFYDRIIRDEKAYLNIIHYIETNPDRWDGI